MQLFSKATDSGKLLWVLTFAFMLINLIFKLYFFTDYSLWYDEVFSVFHSQPSLSEIKHVGKWDVMPPFYYYTLKIWMEVFGISEFAVRSLSLFFDTAAIGALILFTQRNWNIQVSVFAALMYLSSNASFYYAQEARPYSLIFLLSIISAWVYFELLKKPGIIYMALLGVANWALIYTHYIEGFMFIFIQIVLIISYFLKNKKVIYYYAGSIALILALLNSWLKRIYEIFLSGGSKIVAPPRMSDITRVFVELHNNWALALIYALIIAVVLFIFILSYRKLIKEEQYKTIYLLFWSAGIFFIFYFISFYSPMFTKRYLMFILTGIYLTSALFLSKIKIGWIKILIVTIIISVAFVSINYTINKKMDYKNAIAYVKNQKEDSTLIIIQTIDMKKLFAYYFDKNIFIDYRHLKENLQQNDIVSLNDSTWFKDLKRNPTDFKKIILTQTFEWATDPKNTVGEFLNDKLHFEKTINDFDGVKISIYSNEN